MKRILVVDDEVPIRITMRCTLDCSKWQVWETDCGRKALDLVEQESFDLVFLDLHLPDLNGLQVLTAMRERDIRTPVVLISAYGNPELEDNLRELDCFGFLPKPFTPSEVRIAAARALNEV